MNIQASTEAQTQATRSAHAGALQRAQLFSEFVDRLQTHPVSGILLHDLKKQYPLNINLLLFCLWFAWMHYGRLTKKEMMQLLSAITHWHERVFQPLLRLEKQLQDSVIKQWLQEEAGVADEIERRLLTETFLFVETSPRNAQQLLNDASHNVAAYFKCLQFQPELEKVVALLGMVFTTHSASSIAKACEQALHSLVDAPSRCAQFVL